MSNQKRFALIGSGIGPIDKSDALADGDILVYNAATGKWVSQAFSGTAALTEAVQDVVGAMATDNTDINFTYDDGAGTLVATVIESGVDHDALANFVADEHVAHSGVTLTAGAGLTGGGTIAASRTFAVGAGTGITVNADDVAVNAAAVDHDALLNFVSDEHVAHTGVTLTAGAGLTGGGDISASRSFAVGAGTGITVNADDVALTIPVVVSSGGSGAITLTGLLQGNGTSAFTAITNSSTVGQVLRVTGASTYAWGALDLADSDAITGDLPDANLSANVALLNAANVFTATQRITGTTPIFGIGETDAGTDAKNWLIAGNAGTLLYGVANDASPAGLVAAYLTVSRSGTTVTELQFDATAFDFNGAADFSGTLTALGDISTLLTGSIFEGGAGNDARAYWRHDNNASLGFLVEIDSSNTAYLWNYENAATIIGANNVTVASFSQAEIDLTATVLDFNGAADFSSTATGIHWQSNQAGGGGLGWSDDLDTYIDSSANNIRTVAGGVIVAQFSQAEIDLTATTLDFNGAVDISGTLAVGSFGITLANTGAYRWADDTDTFIYLPGANTLAITAGNADVATFSQSEIDLTATTLDFNGNCDVSGTLTRATNTVWDAGNDGSGSGLDADLLDGQHASEFAAGVSGSFTATLTGMTAATTGTINFEISGGMCTLWFRGSTGITGTSNTTAMTMTGLPAACQPAGAVSAPCGNLISNSSANRAGLGQIAAGGSTITFYVADASALWTATGFAAANLKGVYEGWSMTYALT